MEKPIFPVVYWGNRSSRVQFEILSAPPNRELVTSCMVYVCHKNKILLSKPERGWGLPGGHREQNESAEACAIREVYEETGIEISNLQLAGGWKIEKLRQTQSNKRYPKLSYQLLITAKVKAIGEFNPKHESIERIFVKPNEISSYHHNFKPHAAVFNYLANLSFASENQKQEDSLLDKTH